MGKRNRLDVELLTRGLAPSREKAQAFVMAGEVYVNGQKAEKASQSVTSEDTMEVRGAPIPYVSRGGLKLEKAIEVFSLDLHGKNCLDVGASTGGFTDCMLQNEAERVYAVDVGYGQLDWKLRNDERVVVLERRNARVMERGWFQHPLRFAGMDVSFISIGLILPALYRVLEEQAELLALVKPQFEAGRERVGKKGVVRDERVHGGVLGKVIAQARGIGFAPAGLDYSPITGPQGNIEFLLYMRKDGEGRWDSEEDGEIVKKCVQRAHEAHAAKGKK